MSEIHVVGETIGQLVDRLNAVAEDLSHIGAVPNSSFVGADNVQTSFDRLTSTLEMARTRADDELRSLQEGLQHSLERFELVDADLLTSLQTSELSESEPARESGR